MIITLKKEAKPEQIKKLVHRFENMNLKVTVIYGENYNVFGLVGDTSKVDEKKHHGQSYRRQCATCR